MRTQSKLMLGSAAFALLLGAMPVAPALAVSTVVDGYRYNLPAGSDKNLDGVRALIKASDAIGFTRRDADATMNCLGCVTPAMRYKGAGLYNGVDKSEVIIDFDYRFPGVRINTIAAGKESTIVAVKDLVWNESKMGVFASTSTEKPSDRMIPIYILPNAVVYLGQQVADKIKATTVAGITTMTIPMPTYNSEMKATLNTLGQPVKTEMTVGGKVYSGEFSDYTNDRMDMHVFGPQRIVFKVDGKTVTDLTMEYHWSNTYIVFPVPKEVAAK
jgi:hypothetical protein